MTIATLKKKTIAKYNLSGKCGKHKFIVNNKNLVISFNNGLSTANKYTPITNSSCGFSINGVHRNDHSGVGKNMAFSKHLSKSTTVKLKNTKMPIWKGTGGSNGQYNSNVAGIYQTCCSDTKTVKPSVLSYNGGIASKKKWIKLTLPSYVYESYGITNPPYYNETFKVSCNNWVQNIGNQMVETNTQNQYVNDVLKPAVVSCNPPFLSDIPRSNQSFNKYSCREKCSKRIGGKYYYKTSYSKQTTQVPDASIDLNYKKMKRGLLPKSGWQSPWPKPKTNFTCFVDEKSIFDTIVQRSNEQETIVNEKCTETYLANYLKAIKSRPSKKYTVGRSQLFS